MKQTPRYWIPNTLKWVRVKLVWRHDGENVNYCRVNGDSHPAHFPYDMPTSEGDGGHKRVTLDEAIKYLGVAPGAWPWPGDFPAFGVCGEQ